METWSNAITTLKSGSSDDAVSGKTTPWMTSKGIFFKERMSSIIFMCGDWNALTPAERKAAIVPRITTQTEAEMGEMGAEIVDRKDDVIIFTNSETVFHGFRRALCDTDDRSAYARSKLVYVTAEGREESDFHPNGHPRKWPNRAFCYVTDTVSYLLTKNGRLKK